LLASPATPRLAPISTSMPDAHLRPVVVKALP
jgi:hypothetical protein